MEKAQQPAQVQDVQPEIQSSPEQQSTTQPFSKEIPKKKPPILVILLGFVTLLAIGAAKYFGYQNYILRNQKTVTSTLPKLTIKPSDIITNGTTITVGETYKVFFPSGSFSQKTTTELLAEPGCLPPKGPYRVAGYNVRVSNLTDNKDAQKPFILTIDYSSATFTFMKEDSLKVWFCGTTQVNPVYIQSVPTNLDTDKKIITATATKMGVYGLVGELVCPEDSSEYDGDYDFAYMVGNNKGNSIETQYSNVPQIGEYIDRLFFSPEDKDWFKFFKENGKKYYLETSKHAVGVDTIITLINSDGVTKIDEISSDGDIKNTKLDVPPDEGMYFVKVSPTKTSLTGCSAKYDFRVVEE